MQKCIPSPVTILNLSICLFILLFSEKKKKKLGRDIYIESEVSLATLNAPVGGGGFYQYGEFSRYQ